MRRLPLLSTPPAITIADEPFGSDVSALGAHGDARVPGLQVVPAWQARPPRTLRRLSVLAVPLAAGALAAAMWAGGDRTAQVPHEPRATHASRSVPARAIVVGAAM